MGAQYPLCWTGKRRQRGTRKGKVVWPGVLSPATDGRSRLTVSDRWRRKGKVLVGMLSRHPTGGRARLFDGLASLT